MIKIDINQFFFFFFFFTIFFDRNQSFENLYFYRASLVPFTEL